MVNRSVSTVSQNDEMIWMEIEEIDGFQTVEYATTSVNDASTVCCKGGSILMLEVPVGGSPLSAQSAWPDTVPSPDYLALSPCSTLLAAGWETPDSTDLFSVLDGLSLGRGQENSAGDLEESMVQVNNLLVEHEANKLVSNEKDSLLTEMPFMNGMAGEYCGYIQNGQEQTSSGPIGNQFIDNLNTVQDHMASSGGDTLVSSPCEQLKGDGCLNIKVESTPKIVKDPSIITTAADIPEMQANKTRHHMARKKRMEEQARKHWHRVVQVSSEAPPVDAQENCSSSLHLCCSPSHSKVVIPGHPKTLQSSVSVCQNFDEAVLTVLQKSIQKLSSKTRMRIKGSLYRLARSAKERQYEHEHEHGQYNLFSSIRDSQTSSSETITNPIDRSVIRLLFCKSNAAMEAEGDPRTRGGPCIYNSNSLEFYDYCGSFIP